MKYKRILIKLSGEVLAGQKGMGTDFEEVLRICKGIKEIAKNGTQVAIVIGGGNYWRGRTNQHMNRIIADSNGMLATVINALTLHDTFNQLECASVVQTAIEMTEFAEKFVASKAIKHLENGEIVIFGCGTGSPFFSTDTAAALRAAEINADIIIKATNVDGIYTADPKKDKNATKIDRITYLDVLTKGLQVMDSTATSLCMDNNIPIMVLNIDNVDNIKHALMGEQVGTLVE